MKWLVKSLKKNFTITIWNFIQKFFLKYELWNYILKFKSEYHKERLDHVWNSNWIIINFESDSIKIRYQYHSIIAGNCQSSGYSRNILIQMTWSWWIMTKCLTQIFISPIFLEKKWLQCSYSQFYGICRGRWIVFMTEPITLYHDFPAKGAAHILWTIRLKCLLAQITVPWHFYGPIQFQDYTAGYFLTHERTIHLPQKYRTTVKLQQHIFSKGRILSIGWFFE